jgi:hypothetical protein
MAVDSSNRWSHYQDLEKPSRLTDCVFRSQTQIRYAFFVRRNEKDPLRCPARRVVAHQRDEHHQRPDREPWPPAFRGGGLGGHLSSLGHGRPRDSPEFHSSAGGSGA